MAGCFIKTVGYDESSSRLREVYAATISPHGTVDSVYQAQSLSPESIIGHDVLYKAVLHGDHELPPWFLEAVAVYTSLLNHCDYAVTHHGANMRHLVGDDSKFEALFSALENNEPKTDFEPKLAALLEYARELTLRPSGVEQADIEALRLAGASDREILETNQVCACFNYTNRVINGLGIELGDDTIGFYK